MTEQVSQLTEKVLPVTPIRSHVCSCDMGHCTCDNFTCDILEGLFYRRSYTVCLCFVFEWVVCVCFHLLVCGVTCLQCLCKVLLFLGLAVFLGLCSVVVCSELSAVCLCCVWLCGVSYLLSVKCVVCSVLVFLQCAVSLWCGVSYLLSVKCVVCSVLVFLQCAVSLWCELSAAHIAHKSSSNQDINGNLKVL